MVLEDVTVCANCGHAEKQATILEHGTILFQISRNQSNATYAQLLVFCIKQVKCYIFFLASGPRLQRLLRSVPTSRNKDQRRPALIALQAVKDDLRPSRVTYTRFGKTTKPYLWAAQCRHPDSAHAESSLATQ